MPDLAARVARALLEIDAVGFSPAAPITFKSGILSPVYVDNRRLPFHPAQWRVVLDGFREVIAREGLTSDVIAGIALGGVPHSAVLGYLLERPAVFVRPAAKEHGQGRRVESGDVAGRRVLLVEDLVTTGGSSLAGRAALCDEGAVVDTVLAIVSYGFAEATEAFAAAGVRLLTLTDFAAITREAQALGRFGPGEMASIADWLADPHGWAGRQSGP